MKSILVGIHGGDSWNNREQYLSFLRDEFTIASYTPKLPGWKSGVRDVAYTLGWDVYMPEFPSKLNAKYSEWVIIFERILEAIRLSVQDEELVRIVFMGHSLGGCFLLSYLSSDSGFQKFHSMFSHGIFDIEIHSVAGCISAGDFVGPKDSEDWNRFKEISTLFPYHLWHSEDDTIVPFSDAICIHQKSENCILHPFNDRFHFVGPDFTELSREIFCWT